jgi:hypothetical protein
MGAGIYEKTILLLPHDLVGRVERSATRHRSTTAAQTSQEKSKYLNAKDAKDTQ